MTSLILASRVFARFQSLLPERELRQQLAVAAVRVAVPIAFVLALLLVGAPHGGAAGPAVPAVAAAAATAAAAPATAQ